MKKLAAVAVAREPSSAQSAVSDLLSTNAWQTLATIVRESGLQCTPLSFVAAVFS